MYGSRGGGNACVGCMLQGQTRMFHRSGSVSPCSGANKTWSESYRRVPAGPPKGPPGRVMGIHCLHGHLFEYTLAHMLPHPFYDPSTHLYCDFTIWIYCLCPSAQNPGLSLTVNCLISSPKSTFLQAGSQMSALICLSPSYQPEKAWKTPGLVNVRTGKLYGKNASVCAMRG